MPTTATMLPCATRKLMFFNRNAGGCSVSLAMAGCGDVGGPHVNDPCDTTTPSLPFTSSSWMGCFSGSIKNLPIRTAATWHRNVLVLPHAKPRPRGAYSHVDDNGPANWHQLHWQPNEGQIGNSREHRRRSQLVPKRGVTVCGREQGSNRAT